MTQKIKYVLCTEMDGDFFIDLKKYIYIMKLGRVLSSAPANSSCIQI